MAVEVKSKVEIKCDAQNLKQALIVAKSVVSKVHGSHIAYRNKVLCIPKGNNLLSIVAFNKEQLISCDVNAEVSGVESFVIPVNDVIKFIGKEKNVSISVKDKIELKAGSAEIQIFEFMKPEEYIYPKYQFTKEFELPDNFISMLKILNKFKATEDSRPILEGICLESDGKVLSMCAADGFRLAVADIKYENTIDKIIIPGCACELLARYAVKEKVTVSISEDKKTAKFTFANITLETSLVSGKYFAYRILIPTADKLAGAWKFDLNSPMFCQIIDRTMDEGSNIIKLVCEDKKTLKVTKGSEEYYAFFAEIPVNNCINSGHIAFNRNYLLDAAEPFTIMHCKITSPSEQILITGDVEGLTVLIMPMFVQW